MKRSICLCLALILCLGLCACNIKITINKPDQDSGASDQGDPEVMAQLAGEWFGWTTGENPQEMSLTLNADGTCVFNGTAGTWKARCKEQFGISGEFGELDVYLQEYPFGKDCLFVVWDGTVLHRTSDYTRVELTMDNWQQCFAVVNDGAYVETNAFGDITGVTVSQAIRAMPQYNVAFPDHTDEPAVEYTYTTGKYQCTVDMENKTFVLGDLLEQNDEVSGGVGGLNIASEDSITWYAELAGVGAKVTPYPVGEASGLITGFEITRIKGAIYIVNE